MAMELPDLYGECILLPIKSHRPPEPLEKASYKHEKTPCVADISPEAVKHLSYDDLTFARHPRERFTKPKVAGEQPKDDGELFKLPDWFSDNQTATLKIVARKSTGSRGAQVVLCDVVSLPGTIWKDMGHKHKPPTLMVAKIFDPLHYYDSPDMVAEADREYAQEAAAYIHMHEQRNKPAYANKPGLVPRFYGTWTTDITLEHLRKPFMSISDRTANRAQEIRDRAVFDAAAANAGSSTQATRLEPQKFRPVRIILLEHIEGYPLSQFLVQTRDDRGHLVVKPTTQFADESERLAIFGSILDTVSRVEHLGIKPFNIRPSDFMITKTPKTQMLQGSELKSDYDVVMTDFSRAEVTKYTRMGFDLHEKLPLPMHPLCSRSPLAWYAFYGWVPAEFFNLNDVSAYDNWGASHFKMTDYSTQVVIDQVAKSEGWAEHMAKASNLPPRDDDPKWRELINKRHADMNLPEWAKTYENADNFKTKEEYDMAKAEARRILAAGRAEARARERQKQAELVRQCQERIKVLEEEKRAKAEAIAREKKEREAQFAQLGERFKDSTLSDAPEISPPRAEPGQQGTLRDLKSPDSENSQGEPQNQRPGQIREWTSSPYPSGPLRQRGLSSAAGTHDTADTHDTVATRHTGYTARTGDTASTAPTAYSVNVGAQSLSDPRGEQGPSASGGTPLAKHAEAGNDDDADNNSKNDDELFKAD